MYTVVFNHNRSSLRVDGVAEGKNNEPTKDDCQPSVVAAGTTADADKVLDSVAPSEDAAGGARCCRPREINLVQRVKRFGVGGGMLDGLSLGTDHIQNDDSDEKATGKSSSALPGGGVGGGPPPSVQPRKRRHADESTSSTSDSIADLASSSTGSTADGDSSDSSDLGDFGSRGGMAEVVLFAGALAPEDIELMERYPSSPSWWSCCSRLFCPGLVCAGGDWCNHRSLPNACGVTDAWALGFVV